MKSEAVLKASKMHDELDLDGAFFCSPSVLLSPSSRPGQHGRIASCHLCRVAVY